MKTPYARFANVTLGSALNIFGSGTAEIVGATLSKREEGERVEFVVLTRWKSLDAVRAFAGADLDRAVVEPGAVAALSDYDRTVRHYEVLEEVTPDLT